jgi:hypothetical protein
MPSATIWTMTALPPIRSDLRPPDPVRREGPNRFPRLIAPGSRRGQRQRRGHDFGRSVRVRSLIEEDIPSTRLLRPLTISPSRPGRQRPLSSGHGRRQRRDVPTDRGRPVRALAKAVPGRIPAAARER